MILPMSMWEGLSNFCIIYFLTNLYSPAPISLKRQLSGLMQGKTTLLVYPKLAKFQYMDSAGLPSPNPFKGCWKNPTWTCQVFNHLKTTIYTLWMISNHSTIMDCYQEHRDWSPQKRIWLRFGVCSPGTFNCWPFRSASKWTMILTSSCLINSKVSKTKMHDCIKNTTLYTIPCAFWHTWTKNTDVLGSVLLLWHLTEIIPFL